MFPDDPLSPDPSPDADAGVSLTRQRERATLGFPLDCRREETPSQAEEGPPWFREWVQGWMTYQRRRGRAKGSLQTWAWALRDFGSHLALQGVANPADLDRRHLQGWQDRITVRLAPGSQHVAVSTIRGLFKWADREQLTTTSGLGLWLDSPKVPESLARNLAPQDLRRILAYYAPATRELERLRDRALFLFLVTSGARISEALRVDVRDLRGPIRVRQKGGGEQQLIPSARALEWAGLYLRRRGDDGDPALWVRLPPRRGRMNYQDANDIWHALAARLEVPDFTSHALRHTLATELLERGATEVDLQAQLGHASLATIHRYGRVRASRRQQLVDQLDDLIPEPPPARSEDRRGQRGRSAGRIHRRRG